jgi:hypothetical protein
MSILHKGLRIIMACRQNQDDLIIWSGEAIVNPPKSPEQDQQRLYVYQKRYTMRLDNR